MKLNNELLIIDLETTSGQDENGYQTNNDIIQIGAVLLNKNLETLGNFESLVKPREEITQYITDLTGITNDSAINAPTFPEVIKRFEDILFPLVSNVKNIRVCAWGTYFDVPILRRLYKEYLLQYPLSGTAFDIKTLAMMWMSMSNKRTDKLSVEHVANIMDIKPCGKYHNAFVDTDMEAQILKRILQDFNNGCFFNGNLIKLT